MKIELPGRALNVDVAGDDGKPALLLLNSLGATLEMWAPQMAALAKAFRVIRMDMRGHGQSSAPPGPYTVADLAADAMGVLDALKIPRAHVCGLSLGGMTAIWLAAHAGARVDRLVIANSAFAIPTTDMWNTRIKTVETGGIAAIADAVMGRWLSAEFRAAQPETTARMKAMMLVHDSRGYVACCAAVRDAALAGDGRRISAPTLVIAGSRDESTPVASAEAMVAAITGAKLAVLDAAHISNVEKPAEFSAALIEFLTAPAMDDRAHYDAGMVVRRRVLGDAWVDRANANRTKFNEEFQALITRYAWGQVWTRPGLAPATRSCMVLTAMIALGHWDEFRMHVRAAFNNGLDQDAIKEVILQAAIYCGVPAANAAFHHAATVFKEMAEAK